MNSKNQAKPFVKWAGGKRQLLGELVNRLPSDFNCYYEAFVGGGALFFYLQPPKAVLIDINPELINCYKVVRDSLEELIANLEIHINTSDYYYALRSKDRLEEFKTWSDAARAGRFIYLNKTAFNGMWRVNSSNKHNVPYGKYINPKILNKENLQACSFLLNKAELICDSFEVIEHMSDEGDFVYFDPPYVPVSQSSQFTSYSKEKFGLEMQVKLRDLCVRLDKRKINFMLSNSSTEIVKDLYKDFKIEVVKASRAINCKGDKRGKIEELIVRNYA